MSILSAAGAPAFIRRRSLYGWLARYAAGRPGGAFGQARIDPAERVEPLTDSNQAAVNAYFEARNPGTGLLHGLNPNLWCRELNDQLTGVALARDDAGTSWAMSSGLNWNFRYGGTLITPRHVLYCNHGHPHAQGTWRVRADWLARLADNNPPARIRFVDRLGQTIDRIQMWQIGHIYNKDVRAPGPDSSKLNVWPSNLYGAASMDVCLALLDEDLPSTVNVFPFAEPWDNETAKFVQYQRLAYSQSWQAGLDAHQAEYGIHTQADIPGDYPKRNPSMWYGFNHGYPPDPVFANKTYRVWGGDSGTARFISLGGVLVIESILSGMSCSMPSIHVIGGVNTKVYPIQRINAMITDLDNDAIANGRLDTPTGYTVRVVDRFGERIA